MAPQVYVGMSADLIHPGHINILSIAQEYGEVTVGVLTDEAITSYKRRPLMPFSARIQIMMSLKQVTKAIPQDQLDYTPNLLKLKPDFVVHGDDWKVGVQSQTRLKVLKTIQLWNGKLIEPNYLSDFSSTAIQLLLAKYLFDGNTSKRDALNEIDFNQLSWISGPGQISKEFESTQFKNSGYIYAPTPSKVVWDKPYTLLASLYILRQESSRPILLLLPESPTPELNQLFSILTEIGVFGLVIRNLELSNCPEWQPFLRFARRIGLQCFVSNAEKELEQTLGHAKISKISIED